MVARRVTVRAALRRMYPDDHGPFPHVLLAA
jgi:hypothetical protein